MVRVSTFGMFKGRTPEEAISTVVAAGALRANVTESFGATKDVAVGKVNVPEALVVNSLRLTFVAVTTAAALNLVSFAKLTVPAMMLVNPAVVTSVKFTVEVLPAVMIVVPMISSVAISIVFATGAKTVNAIRSSSCPIVTVVAFGAFRFVISAEAAFTVVASVNHSSPLKDPTELMLPFTLMSVKSSREIALFTLTFPLISEILGKAARLMAPS